MAITWAAMNTPDGVNASKTGSSYMRLAIKGPAPGTGETQKYYEIRGCQSIPGLGSSINTVDVTCFADDTKRSIKGIKDAGSGLTIKILHDKDNFKFLKSLEAEGTKFEFQIHFPDASGGATGTVAQFCAYPAVGIDDTSIDGAITDTLTLVVTAPATAGAPVINFNAQAWATLE